MQTELADFIRNTPVGREAEAILRKCVHCGFCTATCPTYQLCGDELDGPRGRIYLIKQVLEGETHAAGIAVIARDHVAFFRLHSYRRFGELTHLHELISHRSDSGNIFRECVHHKLARFV